MSRIENALLDYGSYHTTRGNKLTHMVGIPLIVFSLMGLLRAVTFANEPPVDLAMLLIAGAWIWYLSLDWRLAMCMLVAVTGMYLLAGYIPLSVHIALQIFGWIMQFIGHSVYEGQSPAFLKNVTHLLVGPLWILNDLTGFVEIPHPDESGQQRDHASRAA